MSNPIRRSRRQTKREGKAKQRSTDNDYGEGNSEEDPLEELTRPQLLEINHVFDTIISGNLHKQQSTVRHHQNKTTNTNSGESKNPQQISQGNHAGGFLVGNQDKFEAGGFLFEDESSQGGFLGEDGANLEPGGFFIEKTEADVEGGGFLTEETGADIEGGGFLSDKTGPDIQLEKSINHTKLRPSENGCQSSPSARKIANYIDIQKIPDALKMLNLPHRNSEILDIFENAASSDEDERSDEQDRSTRRKQKLISRMKFSKVCAALMIGNGDEDNSGTDEMDETGEENRRRKRVEEDEDYDVDHDSTEKASSASDYQPAHPQDAPSSHYRTRRGANQSRQSKMSVASGCDPDRVLSKTGPRRRQARGKQSKHSSEGDDDDDDDVRSMDSSALETFALFFQTTTKDSDVIRHTIGFEEIRKAADQLGETMSDEEILEMLNYASYTNNSRVTFHAFEKLMKEIRTV